MLYCIKFGFFKKYSSKDQPIHLYDAFDGHIRASYRCFNHLDEMEAARSLAFDPSGTKLYAGMKNQIRIFDVSIPGRDCDTIKTFDKKEGGQSGIISCIAVSTRTDLIRNFFCHTGYPDADCKK